MKNKKFAIALGLVGLTALAGCTPSSSSSEAPLTDAEFEIAITEIATRVPLVIEKSVGSTIHSNIYRQANGLPTPELKDGNDFILIEAGNLSYEDDDNGVYLNQSYTIAWSYNNNAALASFEFVRDDKGQLNAVPEYPVYDLEFDDYGNDISVIPPAKAGRLYAVVTIGTHQRTINYDVTLMPIERVTDYNLVALRDVAAGTIARVRGYVIGVHADSNSAGIMDGQWGYGLYRLDSDFKGVIKKGNLVEVVGSVSTFNGLAQIQWIKKLKILDPEDFPEIKKPVTTSFTHDQLADQLSRAGTDFTGPLQDRDNALVKFETPFKFLRVEDRNGVNVGFDKFDITGKVHTNVILEGKKSDGETFEVTLSINYHMLSENQIAFKNFLEANQTKEFFYEGPLSAYNKLVLGPYEWTADTLKLA